MPGPARTERAAASALGAIEPLGSRRPRSSSGVALETGSATGGQAAIGRLEDAALLLVGRAGTRVRSSHGRGPRPHPDGNPETGQQSWLDGAAPTSG